MYQLLLHFINLFYKSNSIFTFATKDFGFGKYSLIYTMSFLSIQLLNELSYPFDLTYNLLPFLCITFFKSKLFLICFLQFLFVTISFALRSLTTYVHCTVFVTFLIAKKFFRPIRNINFCKNIFIFWYSNIISFKFRTFLY